MTTQPGKRKMKTIMSKIRRSTGTIPPGVKLGTTTAPARHSALKATGAIHANLKIALAVALGIEKKNADALFPRLKLKGERLFAPQQPGRKPRPVVTGKAKGDCLMPSGAKNRLVQCLPVSIRRTKSRK